MERIDRGRHARPALGVRIERWIESVEGRAGGGPLRATLLGAGLGIATVGGGIGLFLVVWFLLVDVLP